MKVILLFLFFISFIICSNPPGIIVTIGGEALEEGLDVNLPNIITSQLQNKTIPSIAGTTNNDQSFIIIHVSDSGTGNLYFYDGDYDIKFTIKEKDGKPYFDITHNNLALGHVVKQELQDIVQDTVNDIFNKINDEINLIPTDFPLPAQISFNWELLSDFDTSQSNGFGSFYSAGYFIPSNNVNSIPPFDIQSLPSFVNNDTIQVIISEYTFESLGWALFQASSLDISIPFGTTSDWRLLLPALYRAYPKEDIQASFIFNNYPLFSLNTTGLILQTSPLMNWNINTNGTITNAFTLALTIEASIDLYFNDTTQLLHGKVGVATFDMSLQSTNIGDFSLFQLETAIHTAIYAILLPSINTVLRTGIPIPEIYGITLKNPIIMFEDNYMYLTTSIQHSNSNSTSYYNLLPQLLKCF